LSKFGLSLSEYAKQIKQMVLAKPIGEPHCAAKDITKTHNNAYHSFNNKWMTFKNLRAEQRASQGY